MDVFASRVCWWWLPVCAVQLTWETSTGWGPANHGAWGRKKERRRVTLQTPLIGKLAGSRLCFFLLTFIVLFNPSTL